MLDFLMVSIRNPKLGVYEIFPKFIIKKSDDLMIRGGDFYAIWDAELNLWSTDEDDAKRLIDDEIKKFAEEKRQGLGPEAQLKIKWMWDSESGVIDKFHKYCQKQMRDNYHPLDEKLIFADTPVKKKDYASRKLSYSLKKGDISAYNDLMSTLYSPEERQKIEWAIGSVIQGDSAKIQQFIVMYGAPGTGKGTVIKILQLLFQDYATAFESRILGSATAAFPLEQFRSNPLVAFDGDGDLSRIENNTRLNSLISHEPMPVYEKFKPSYVMAFKCMLFIGSNKVVKITDARSGLLRRLIEVSPTGTTLDEARYLADMEKIKFELGAIAYYCRQVYLDNMYAYRGYVPVKMLESSNHFYNFMVEYYDEFTKNNGVTLRTAWDWYKKFCDESNFQYTQNRLQFAEELKSYFRKYEPRAELSDGTVVRQYYSGFHIELGNQIREVDERKESYVISMDSTDSIFDALYADCPAQYANNRETPTLAWADVTTTLNDLDTTQLHYVKVPKEMVVIDFDLKDENGNKSIERNLDAASKWPKTYAELSKGGQGIHLHYLYSGDVTKLSSYYDEGIEVKVFTGGSSLRRRLTKCNNLPIAPIDSGLPLKEVKQVVNQKQIQSEQSLRDLVERCLRKEIEPHATKPLIDFIDKILTDAYNSGLRYDLTNMRNKVSAFAAGSTHNPQYCLRVVNKMKFKSGEDHEEAVTTTPDVIEADGPIAFFDIETLPDDENAPDDNPGLFLINWMYRDEELGKKVKKWLSCKYGTPDWKKYQKEAIEYLNTLKVMRMINPSPESVDKLFVKNPNRIRWIGFNNRRYDNHMVYARSMGYTQHELYLLSQRMIVKKDQNAKFGSAYDISYADIWEYASDKQGLKKWEIEMGYHHQELGWPWDKPLPKDMWIKAAEYCDNDVRATALLYEYIHGDFEAQEMLAKLATVIGGVPSRVNDNGNAIVQNLIFGKDRNPQAQFEYRNMAEKTDESMWCYKDFLAGDPKAHIKFGKPYFPGYKYFYHPEEKKFLSTYRDEDGSPLPKELCTPKRSHREVREGGYVFATKGMYISTKPGEVVVQTEDVASMHPASLIAENLFGKYTQVFADLRQLRIFIKHKDYESARKMFGGAIAEFLTDDASAKVVSHALKIAINKVYGMTSSPSDYFRCKDPRNKDNIVAKRGALFMIDLRNAVQEKGYTVVHVKTDSIKILKPDPYILDFVKQMGEAYGYEFETEAKFDKLCLVNDSVYVGHCTEDSPEYAGEWTFTGKEFQIPFISKILFTHEPIEFKDLCITQSSKEGALYLNMNEGLPSADEMAAEVTKIKILLSTQEPDLYNGRKKRYCHQFDHFDWLQLVPEDFERLLHERWEFLEKEMEKCHDYQFVGRVGSFVPIKPGCGGGELLVLNKGVYGYANGCKGYRFLEEETVLRLHKEDDVDRSYFISMADKAREHINEMGDFEMFVSDDSRKPQYDFINIPEGVDMEVPFE